MRRRRRVPERRPQTRFWMRPKLGGGGPGGRRDAAAVFAPAGAPPALLVAARQVGRIFGFRAGFQAG
eukprot:9664683-Lingulodinium_polyedra.AAC.1